MRIPLYGTLRRVRMSPVATAPSQEEPKTFHDALLLAIQQAGSIRALGKLYRPDKVEDGRKTIKRWLAKYRDTDGAPRLESLENLARVTGIDFVRYDVTRGHVRRDLEIALERLEKELASEVARGETLEREVAELRRLIEALRGRGAGEDSPPPIVVS
jgi:hypothetical protein